MQPEWVQRYLGLPYADRGRGPEAFDCWGLVRQALIDQAGLSPPCAAERYADRTDSIGMASAFDDYLGDWEAVSAPRLFDVVLLRLGEIRHCGLIVAPGWMLHVGAGFNPSCVDRLSRFYWRNRLLGYYRYAQ